MNVYDFDETIFTGDSEDRFFEYIFAKKGFKLYQLNFKFYDMLFKMGVIPKTISREHQYKFLKKIDNLDETLESYWDTVEQYLKPWYNDVKRDDDIIASGSPRFLLVPILKRLGLTNLVATEMDEKTGDINGDFAVGEFKLVNFKALYGTDCIDKFYSDAWSDRFIADCAKEAYAVHDDDQISDWTEYFDAHPEKKKKK